MQENTGISSENARGGPYLKWGGAETCSSKRGFTRKRMDSLSYAGIDYEPWTKRGSSSS